MIYPELDNTCISNFEFSVDHESVRIDNRTEMFESKFKGEISKETNRYMFPSEHVKTYASIIPPDTTNIDRLINFYKHILHSIVDISLSLGVNIEMNEYKITFIHHGFTSHQVLAIIFEVSGESIFVNSVQFNTSESHIL